MIDIHSHILFGMDDGAQTPEESLELCRKARGGGVRIVVCTPHFTDYPLISDFARERDERLGELSDMLDKNGVELSLAAGAELFLSDDIFSCGDLDALTLNGSSYMLCEFPLGPFNIRRAPLWIEELTERGYIPVVAHPERYYEFYGHPTIIDELLDFGVIFQVNFDSLLGANGEAAKASAAKLVVSGKAQLIAGDSHDSLYRPPVNKALFAELDAEITDRILKRCLISNPKAVLSDKKIF